MAKLIDAVAGALEYDYGWCRQVNVNFCGESCAIKLAFAGDEDQELDPGQRDAFAAFWSLRDTLLSNAGTAILSHYKDVRSGVLARITEDDAKESAPLVENTSDLNRIVRLESLFFPEDFGTGARVAGLLAECSWDPSLGLAVRFEDEQIVGVGPQDIVL